MSSSHPSIQRFAEKLVAFEAQDNKAGTKHTPAAFLVCEKLRPQLSSLMGNAGFRALLARALALASAKAPSLRGLAVKADGSLSGLDERAALSDDGKLGDDSVQLVAQLLGLLTAFIGDVLTLRFVHEVWPKFPPGDLNFGNGEKK